MKFEHNGLRFEVSHIDHIVANTVRRIILPAENGKPARVTNKIERVEDAGTRVWYRLKFQKGIRWAKFRYHGELPDNSALLDPELTLADAVMWDTPAGVQKGIMEAMQRPDIRVWFSGSYCNIQICENWQEVKRIQAQEERRKNRARAARILKSPRVNEIIDTAARNLAEQFRRDITGPLGPMLFVKDSQGRL